MSKKNVLLVGISGAGKSTLINGMVGQHVAKTTRGDATTQEITQYSNDNLEFNMVDTRGFEYNLLTQQKIVRDMKKLIKKGLSDEVEEKEVSDLISCIWYCVAATDGRLHEHNLKSLKSIIKEWKGVPVIVVLTKSYSLPEISKNIEMVKEQFAKYAKKVNLQGVIPVVADPYPITDDYVVGQFGIEELVEKTNNILQVVDISGAVEEFKSKQRNKKAEMLIAAYAAGAATIGAIPIPRADAPILATLETKMIRDLGKIYGIQEGENANVTSLFKSLVTAGTVGVIAKKAVSLIKSISYFNLLADAVNAVMAASIVEMLGHLCMVVFENLNSGKLSLDKMDEIEAFIKKYVGENVPAFVGKIEKLVEKQGSKINIKDLIKIFNTK